MLTGVFDRVTNNPYVGINGSPIGVIEFAYDTRLLGTAIALNLGYRFRRKGQPIPGVSILPMGNQYLASLGLSYLLPFVDTKLIVEAFGSRPAEGATSGIRARQASSAELLAGVKHDLTTNASVHFGGGTELINGASSPDWRAYVGINWAFGPAFTPESRGKILQPSAPKEEKAVVRSINFDSGSDRVPPAAVAMLQTLADEITAKPFSKVYVEGHTDSVGSADANRRLSLRRAQGVRQWLITKGKIPADKIEALGVGEDSPIADNGNFQGRALNRRVEFRVIR
jgi:outer membrane protein OmpA-like peptidoglycan-associated protein